MSYGNSHGKHEKPEEKTGKRKKPETEHIRPSSERYRTDNANKNNAVRQSRKTRPAPKAAGHAPNVGRTLRNVLVTIVLVAAVSVLLASFKMPVIRVYGDSMMPLLGEGDIIVGIKDSRIRPNDVVGVYYGNKLLTKRCIAVAGQTVDMDESGNVSVDGTVLDEPYAVNKAALAETLDIETPYVVPHESIFVLGDNRSSPADSRSSDVGCFHVEDVCGRLIFRIWPLPLKVFK